MPFLCGKNLNNKEKFYNKFLKASLLKMPFLYHSAQNLLEGLQKNPNRLDYLGEKSYLLNLYTFEDDYFQKLLNSSFEIDKLKIKIEILDNFEKEKLISQLKERKIKIGRLTLNTGQK